jgi:hypothetical protein
MSAGLRPFTIFGGGSAGAPIGDSGSISVKTANFTATIANGFIICNSVTPITITLYNANTASAIPLTVQNKNIGTVTIDATGKGQINGSNTVTLSQYTSLTLVPDGTNWNVT